MIRQLKETIPIEKAQMRIRIVLPKDCAKKLKEKLMPSIATVESEDWDCGKLDLVSFHFTHTPSELLRKVFVRFLLSFALYC